MPEETVQNPQTPKASEPTKSPKKSKSSSSSKAPMIVTIVVLILVLGVVAYFMFMQNDDSDNNSDTGQTNTQQNQPDTVVATVNGEEIMSSTVNYRTGQLLAGSVQPGQEPSAELQAQAQQTALTQLVNETLLLQQAATDQIEVTNQEVEEQYQAVVARFDSVEQFNQLLASQNLSESDVRADIRRQLLIEGYLATQIDYEGIEVTEEEIEERYNISVEGQENVPELEEVSDQIEQQLRSEKADVLLQELLNELSQQADIQVLQGA